MGIPYTEEEKEETHIIGSDIAHICYCGYEITEEPMDATLHCPCCDGTCEHVKHLRVAKFNSLDGRCMIAEEYFAIDDHDCDGTSVISTAIYEDGKRPLLVTQVLDAR